MDPLRSTLWPALQWCVRALRGAPLLVCVALGWLVGDATGGRGAAAPPLLLAASAATAALLLFASEVAWRRIGVALLALAIGNVAAARVYQPSFSPDHIAMAPTHTPVTIEALLTADPELQGERVRLWVRAGRIDDGRGWRATHGDLLLTMRHTEQSWHTGDTLQGTVSLQRPRNFGNPNEFDYAGYWARRGIYVRAFAYDDAEFARLNHADSGIAGWLTRWRRGVGALIRQTLPEPQAEVLSALVIGTMTALPTDLRAAFNRAGVSHVLSISGLHVGLVAAAGYTLFRWLLARSSWLLLTANVPKLAVALSIVPVLLYAGIAGSNVATTRSVLMIVVFVAAVLVDRQRHLIVSLAAAAIIILATAPGASLDISFQLSFVAVLGLVLGMQRFWPWWQRWEEAYLLRLRGWRGRLWRPLAVYAVVSLSALAATTPLTAWHFNQVSFIAVLANALVVPLLGSIAVALGLLAAVVFLASEQLAQVCISVAGPFVQLGVWVVEVLAAFPYAAVRVVTPTTFELALVYAALLALIRLAGRARPMALALLALAALGDGAWWYADRYQRSDLRLTFLSVGHGDAAVVEFPGSQVMVIDGGGLGDGALDVGERIIAPFLWSRKIARVDYLVLSHPQWDHYGGLAFVAEHFQPREFWSNGTVAASPRFARLQHGLMENGVRHVVLRRGDRRRIDVVEAAVESPADPLDGLSVNNQSLVFSLAFGRTRMLFPGDIEAVTEEELVAAADGALASAILKVPHHGSDTSSSMRFLDAVAPRLAVVSTDFENRFGFPHPQILARYAALHSQLVRTDLDGAVVVRIRADGRIETHRFRGGSHG